MINDQIQLDKDYLGLLLRHSFSDNGAGYPTAWVNGKKEYLHHLIIRPQTGMVIDHINGNKYDNRLTNLREITQKENTRNRKTNKNNLSGVSGVFFDSRINKWLARITVDYKSLHLGSFETKEKAITVRKQAEVTYWEKANGSTASSRGKAGQKRLQ